MGVCTGKSEEPEKVTIKTIQYIRATKRHTTKLIKPMSGRTKKKKNNNEWMRPMTQEVTKRYRHIFGLMMVK